ncbi:voltage-dependent anion channel [Xylaria sp. FL1042]|nr:voltage-dependent anion channel [Xylaria sp. FL1042]
MDDQKPTRNLEPSKESEPDGSNVGFRGFIKRFTWANFTCTQSTGGVAIMLSQTPHQFHGLQTVGVVVFILNLVLFVCFCTAMLTRFILHPRIFKRSLVTPPECFFVGSFWLSIATMIMCMERFGVQHTGPWLVVVIRVLFWIYGAVTLTYTTATFAILYSKPIIKPGDIPPALFITVYNTMLTGTIAGSIAGSQPPAERLSIIVAGVTYQGLGWILSLVLMSWFVGNTIGNGPGSPSQRPSLFLTVGSSGYTIVSLMGCAQNLPNGYSYFARHPSGVEVLQVMADWIGVFLWLWTFWLFATALLVNLPTVLPRIGPGFRVNVRMNFDVKWWGMIFPNVGFTLATDYIGRQFQSDAIQWVGTVMTAVLFAFWLMNLVLYAKACVSNVISSNKAKQPKCIELYQERAKTRTTGI